MASNIDFQFLFDEYQDDDIKQDISIVQYCQMDSVVYSHFECWYKKYRISVVLPVEIIDADGLIDKSKKYFSSVCCDNGCSFVVSVTLVNIVFLNSLEMSHHNLSHPSLFLCVMLEKLEVLC